MSAAPALPPKAGSPPILLRRRSAELTSKAVLIRRPTAAQQRHFKARLYHLIYDRHRCHDGRRIGRILRLDQFPMSGGGPGGLQASRVLRTGCHELRQEVIHIGPALKSAVHIRVLAHEDDLLVSHCAGQQHEQRRLPPGLGSSTHSSGLITQSGCVRRPRRLRPSGRYLFEGRARVGENNGCARFRLIASNNDIDVEWIELHAAAYPPGILGSDQGRPRAKEGSRTISPRFVRSISASCSIAVGFTVG